MNEEYVWKEATGKLVVLDTKPSHNITFHNGDKQMGALDFNGPEMVFTGDADESAKVFFDYVATAFKARLEQERKPLTEDEIEAVWKRVQANDFHDCVQPFARAIEAAHGIKENT